MKIGILTFHRAHNYGAVLQAYSLKKNLESLGNDVIFVDYFDSDHLSLYSLWGRGGIENISFWSRIKTFVKQVVLFNKRYSRYKKFENFIAFYLGCKERKVKFLFPEQIEDLCDLYVYGSDQIWRSDRFVKGFYDVYWGIFPKSSVRKISYAASMGEIVDTEQSISFVKKNLNNFASISVREENLKIFLNKIYPQKEIAVVCDPTLLTSKEEWVRDFALKKRTSKTCKILFYNLLHSKKANQIVNDLLLKDDCDLIELNGSVELFRKKTSKQIAGPIEFLEYFFNADVVVSTSFHGVVFAIIFEKEFYATGMEGNNNRVLTLLNKLGLSDRYIDTNHSISQLKNIDYSKVKEKLKDYVRESKEYLFKNIYS